MLFTTSFVKSIGFKMVIILISYFKFLPVEGVILYSLLFKLVVNLVSSTIHYVGDLIALQKLIIL